LPFAKLFSAVWFSPAVSTLIEIQDAVAHLPGNERKALQVWLNSQTESALTPTEEQRLLRSLDEAVRDIDAGKGVPINDVRQRVASWAAK
jgi:site-specific recombinase XerC